MLETDREVSAILAKATGSYLLHYGFSVFFELGLSDYGKLRADAIGLNHKRGIVCCEIKSSLSDFKRDKKWQRYLDFCNKMYFVIPNYLFVSSKDTIISNIKPLGVGLLVLDKEGYLRSKVSAKTKDMSSKNKEDLVYRMAWRAGDVSNRKNIRHKYFLSRDNSDTLISN